MIALNQTGYLPKAEKRAALTKGKHFRVKNEKGKIVLEKDAVWFGTDEASRDEIAAAEFSEIEEPGFYVIETDADEISYRFRIGEDVYRNLQKDLLKAFYFQRCGCELKEAYAGPYTHACCHTEDAVLWEDSSVSKEVTGGWHDAGDYGRYVSPAAVAVAHLLYAYLLFPECFKEPIGLPESGNGVPDILNECRYELEWMLKMQAPDGGAYHKLTSMRHADFIMPEEDKSRFYLFPVSSMATADYAAVMALAYRVYKKAAPDFADRLFMAAEKAYGWLENNPEYLGFYNPPGCNTGEYDDVCDLDERIWAAAELLEATGDLKYEKDIKVLCEKGRTGLVDFGWTDVSGLASMAILTGEVQTDTKETFLNAVLSEADRLTGLSRECGYGVAMKPEDYVWGSNMVVLNRGMLLVLAALSVDKKEEKARVQYEKTALNQLHYLLGKNATGYSYVTGYGEKACRHPHNRPTECDGIEEPMPGFVSGGPFKTPADETAKEFIPDGTPPMKCYLDDARCYSLNEITIYWNSPAVFVTAYFNRR